MSRAAPERGNARPRPGQRAPKRYIRHLSYRANLLHANAKRLGLIVQRYSAGLLPPFVCSNCGVVSLDCLGWDGPRKPLCDYCADPEYP
jgi:hypothetical protein